MRSPIYTPKGKLSYLVNDDRNQYPVEVELAGDGDKPLEMQPLLTQQGSVATWDAAAGHTAVLYTNDSDPAEIYALENGALRKLTTHNDALMAELNLVPTEDIEFKSKDGTDVHGLLTKPEAFKEGSPVPLSLIHI